MRTETARCSPSRRMSFDGRPQSDPRFGRNGLVLGAHTMVVIL
jgi:hypothetical protein